MSETPTYMSPRVAPRRLPSDEATALAEADLRRRALAKAPFLNCVARGVTDAIGENA